MYYYLYLCCFYKLSSIQFEWDFNTVQIVNMYAKYYLGKSNKESFDTWKHPLMSVRLNKTVARKETICHLSELWYFQYRSKQKIPQFWKNRDSRNCLVQMNGLQDFLIQISPSHPATYLSTIGGPWYFW